MTQVTCRRCGGWVYGELDLLTGSEAVCLACGWRQGVGAGPADAAPVRLRSYSGLTQAVVAFGQGRWSWSLDELARHLVQTGVRPNLDRARVTARDWTDNHRRLLVRVGSGRWRLASEPAGPPQAGRGPAA